MKPRLPPAPASIPEPPPDIFQQAFLNSPAMQSVVRAADGVLIQVNNTFLAKLGFTREQVIGRAAPDLGFWVDPNGPLDFKEELERNGFIRGREVRLRGPEGTILTILLSTQIVRIGGETYFVSAGVDITERKAADARLRESEARLRESEQRLRETEAHTRALYESLSAAVVVHDETGFLQANAAAAKMFGATRAEELIGLNPGNLSPRVQPDSSDSAVAAQRHTARAMHEGTTRFEWRGRRLDGSEMPLDVTLTALELGGRKVIQAVIVDLTERKRAEVEMQKALAQERELSQLKTDFVSVVSHEFRTPLEIIMSSADNLDRYHDRLAPAKRQQLLRTINKSVRRMADMMEEVLLLGRMDSNRVEFRPVAFDLAALCRRLRDEMESATSGRCPLQLETKKLPAKARGDESVIRHILTNLVSNAVKYSAAGALVTITVARDKANAVFRIVDRGCGIPAADQPRLFQAFHRAANVRHIAGTGLGLVIVQRCVALHGGRIAVESVEGEGTTFVVSLPLFAARKAEAQP